MILLARLFKFLFRFEFFKKRYFGIYRRIIRAWGLFKNTEVTAVYDKTLNIKLSLRDWIQQQIYFFGYYDLRGIQFVKACLKPDDTFIDIGGNVGAYSLIAAKLVGSKGEVIAFEPVTEVRERFLENASLNQLDQLKVEPYALFNETTKLQLHISNQDNFGMSSIHAHDEQVGRTEEVEAIRFDDYVLENKLKRIDLIKMDIEGAELYALNGMKSTLQQFKPLVLIEISSDVLNGTTLTTDEIYTFFKELNYSPFCIQKDGQLTAYTSEMKVDYTNFVFKPN